MPEIKTKIDLQSEDFKQNKAANMALAVELKVIEEKVMEGGPKRSRERHASRGKLLPRERIRRLLDSD